MTRRKIPLAGQFQGVVRMKIAEFQLLRERDMKDCARRARLLAGLADLTRRQRTNLSKAFQQAARALAINSRPIRVEFAYLGDDGHQTIEVVVRSSGGKVVKNELANLGELVDHFWLSGDETGETVIRLGQELPADARLRQERELLEWSLLLRAKSTEVALIEAQRRINSGTAEQAAARIRAGDLQEHLKLDGSSLETLNMLSSVANETDNLVMILDARGFVEWVNAAFTRLTGYTFNEVTGTQPFNFLFGAATAAESRGALEDALRQGHGTSEDIQLFKKDGAPLWVALTVTPIVDDGGSVSRWIGLGADITRRQQAHEVLEKAKQAAEAASRAKSGFLANMSHEIRTPMNAIIGMTELALATELNAAQRDYLTMVKQSAEALLELLNDILDLSKIESGKIEIEASPFDLNDLLATTLGPLAVRAHAKDLEFAWHLQPEVPAHLVGDPYRLRQIVMNLVSNAVKFTEHGQVSLEVHNQWESDDEVSLHFSVIDTGIGIPADRMDRIFGTFEQADSSTTRRYGGTGLGLAICNQLAQLLGGKIWVQSQVGRGSVFHFSLRLKKSRPLGTQAQNNGGESDDQSSGLRKRLRGHGVAPPQPQHAAAKLSILIADDHEPNRDLAGAILEKRGHRVAFAENGHEAIAAVARESFDVVLMDVQMPEMDGFQATAAIRASEGEARTHVPIIALTAHAMKGDREKCLAGGMDAYLAKPVDAMELQTLVECLAGIGGADRSAGSGALPARPLGDAGQPSQVTAGSAGPQSPAAPQPAQQHDFSGPLERLMGDRTLLRRQMEFFVNDGPKLLRLINSSIDENDADKLKLAAHRLKGFSASFDASRAADLARQLEAVELHREPQESRILAQELGDCVADLGRAIEAYLLSTENGQHE